MPIDGHAHLVSQGWSGKGNGLRHGAITKPITVVQKKTLAGIGKERDEAFPFWDHVFQAAAVSIQLKLHNSDDESESEEDSSNTELNLRRTSTGIISNRRPTSGTPALSGANTPSESQSGTSSESGAVTPRLSIMATAKQQAARRMLYSMFYRGPVLSTEEEQAVIEDLKNVAGPSTPSATSATDSESPRKTVKVKKSGKGSKRKADTDGLMDEDEAKREKKRRKREARALESADSTQSTRKGKERLQDEDGGDAQTDVSQSKAAKRAAKAEKRRRKEERRVRREQKRQRKAAREAAKADVTVSDTGLGDGRIEAAGIPQDVEKNVRERKSKKGKRNGDVSDALLRDGKRRMAKVS